MGVLSWEKPERIMSVESWKKISADGAPPGVYTPNMSTEDKLKWKATLVGKTTDNPRIEIRKTFSWHNGKNYPEAESHYSQTLIVVQKNSKPEVLMSCNGKIAATMKEMEDMHIAIREAKEMLNNLTSQAPKKHKK